jgi:hypothetical protein
MPGITPINLLLELLTAGGASAEIAEIARGATITARGLKELAESLSRPGTKAQLKASGGVRAPTALGRDIASLLQEIAAGRPLTGPKGPGGPAAGVSGRGGGRSITGGTRGGGGLSGGDQPPNRPGALGTPSGGPPPPGSGIGGAVQMQRVQSSNVYAIGYDYGTGTILIQFLGGKGGSRAGPGPTYDYYDVMPKIWENFLNAGSKGKWIWDNLRIRGTISGHRYEYRLVSGFNYQIKTESGGKSKIRSVHYIPRLATGEGFEKRTRVVAGVKQRSRLPNFQFTSPEGKGKKFFLGR